MEQAMFETHTNPSANDTGRYVLVFCAHSDDQVFGAGGTIARLSAEGFTVITIILSHGEMSHPWLKKEPLARHRIQESVKAARVLGIRTTIFFDLPEDRIHESYTEHAALQDALLTLLEKHPPERIFTHSDEDTHPSHRQVHLVVREAYRQLKERHPDFTADIYAYDIWTIAHFKRRDRKWVYYDITDHFQKKIRALKTFRTQRIALVTLWLSVYGKAYLYGLFAHYRLAERFSKISFE